MFVSFTFYHIVPRDLFRIKLHNGYKIQTEKCFMMNLGCSMTHSTFPSLIKHFRNTPGWHTLYLVLIAFTPFRLVEIRKIIQSVNYSRNMVMSNFSLSDQVLIQVQILPYLMNHKHSLTQEDHLLKSSIHLGATRFLTVMLMSNFTQSPEQGKHYKHHVHPFQVIHMCIYMCHKNLHDYIHC